MRSVPPVVILSADGIYYSQRAGRSGFADWGATAAASRILELGLRELNADAQAGFDGAADVLELLAGLPAPEEILKLRPSPRLSARIAEWVEKSRGGEMTPSDHEDWERYEYLEHLVRMAKAAAHLKLAPSQADV
jgi:hypothetical protein